MFYLFNTFTCHFNWVQVLFGLILMGGAIRYQWNFLERDKGYFQMWVGIILTSAGAFFIGTGLGRDF